MGGYNQGSFRKGESLGRTPGSQNRSSYELRERLKKRGGLDPAEFLHDLVSDEKNSQELRVAASNVLMPYLYNKLAPIAPPPLPILLEEQVVLPHTNPATLLQVRENIAYLTQLKMEGRLDRVWAESLIDDQRALNNSLVDEAKLIAANQVNADHVIRIEGGLPQLPGTDIIMPDLPPALDMIEAALQPVSSTVGSLPNEPESPITSA
jgi:hypothetical protein